MATQTTTQPALNANRGGLLKRALQVDAILSTALGVLLVAAAAPLADFTGINMIALEVVGLVTALYGGWIFWSLPRKFGAYGLPITVVALNIAWVLGSALLVFTDWVPMTVIGKWSVVAVADVVLLLAAAEIVGLRRARSVEA
ncbi:MAG TPA: hypothetical protein VFR15_12460 [Chloroflexia bacterium]|nr:hypothetical protein [Chloroflexia bacterium]